MKLEGVNMCFGCGKDNPIGLKLKFEIKDETASGEFTPDTIHQGYAGIMHGGIMASLLDEAAGRLLYDLGYSSVTAKLEVRFKKPAKTGEKIRIFCRIKDKKRRMITTLSQTFNSDGELLADAEAVFVIP